MAFDAHKNFAYSTVLTAPSPDDSGTSLVVQSGDGTKFPAVPFNATVWPAGAQPLTTNAEIVRVTNISTDTFTITRAQESSSARHIAVGYQIAATVTAKTFTDIETGGFLAMTALLSTIFSDQVQTQANTGTSGGNMWWLNLGGIKILWGIGTDKTIGTAGNTYTFILPTFFTTFQNYMATSINVTIDGRQYSCIDSTNFGTNTINVISTAGANGCSCRQAIFLIGT